MSNFMSGKDFILIQGSYYGSRVQYANSIKIPRDIVERIDSLQYENTQLNQKVKDLERLVKDLLYHPDSSFIKEMDKKWNTSTK